MNKGDERSSSSLFLHVLGSHLDTKKIDGAASTKRPHGAVSMETGGGLVDSRNIHTALDIGR
jgi:hypothetical protein